MTTTSAPATQAPAPAEEAPPAEHDPRLRGPRRDTWLDRVLFFLPGRMRSLGVLAAILWILWILAAGDGQWTYLGQQLVAGLGLGAIAALSGTGLVVAYRATGVFNFAQGGIATIAAFVLYEFTTYHHVPVALGLVIVVLVVAPAIGAAMDIIVFRPLQRRSAGTAEKLVANLGVLILLLGIGGVIYGETTLQPDAVFPSTQVFQVGSGNSAVGVPWSVLGNVLLIAAAAGGLMLLFRYTSLGRQVRAVVDRRGLAELCVVNANRVSMLAWGFGAAFAALAGVLYAPLGGLQNGYLTLQVLQTIGVAVIAKLRNVGAAVAAGLGLGVVQSLSFALVTPHYPGWLSLPAVPQAVVVELPVLSTMVFLLIYRTLDEVGVSRTSGLVTAMFGRGSRRSTAFTVQSALLLLLAVVVIPALINGGNLATAQQVVAYAVAFLSIVAITGYSGHISLATAAFAGLGGYVTARLSNGLLPLPVSTTIPHVPVILAMLIGGLVVIPLGVLIGYPALRRKGLILGLITLAFAQIIDSFVFQQPSWSSAGRVVSRPSLFGWSLGGDRAFLYYELVVLGLVSLLTRNLRSGSLGRILGAMRDSEIGSVSIGISLRRYKLLIFGASAFIAAIGGSLIAQQQFALNLNEDGPFSPLSGLYWFGAVVVFGLSYRAGAVLAAVLFVVVDVVTGQAHSSLVLIGVIALFIGYLPGGVIGSLQRLFQRDPVDGSSPVRRSLARYAIAQRDAAAAPPPGTGMRATRFAERLLTGAQK